MKKKCFFCRRVRGHKQDCLFFGTKNTKPNLTIPSHITTKERPDGEYLVIIPVPNTIDSFIYATVADLKDIMRANKNKPDAIQFLSDMLE